MATAENAQRQAVSTTVSFSEHGSGGKQKITKTACNVLVAKNGELRCIPSKFSTLRPPDKPVAIDVLTLFSGKAVPAVRHFCHVASNNIFCNKMLWHSAFLNEPIVSFFA
ncbi:hypothetical protein [Undibacterium squillarum]|uniref:hypothetical protein n=1 Tax=Undibacterium squillarum TaxID=1131567 RepID=UPI0035B461D3